MTLILNPPPTQRRVARPNPHLGPKARLDEALKPDTTLRRVGRDYLILGRVIPLLLLPAAGVAALWMFPPEFAVTLTDWRSWIDPVAFVLVAIAICAVFAREARRVARDWRNSRPDSPVAALQEFYRLASMRKPRRRRMAALVRGFPDNAPALRPVMTWMTAAGFPRIDSPKTLARYWRSLLRGNPGVTRRMKIEWIKADHPLGDVALVIVRLRVWSSRRVRAAIAALIGVAVVVAPIAVGPEWLDQRGIPFWGAIAGALLVGVTAAIVLRKLLRADMDAREVTLRKILVYAGWDWRLVNGEWESADEEDVQWLLDSPRARSTNRL
jgi:hypothetical protein